MAFDLASAKPAGGFDLSTASPVASDEAIAAGKKYADVFTDKPGFVSQLGRTALMNAGALAEGIAALPALGMQGLYKAANAAISPLGVRIPENEMPLSVLDYYRGKMPSPQNKLEQYANAALTGAGSVLSGAGLAGAGSLASASPTANRLLAVMADRPALQAVSGAASGVSSQGAADAGLGPYAQMGAGIVGGLLPGTLASIGSKAATVATESKAKDILTKRLADAGLTPGQAADSITSGQTIAELSKPTADLAGAVVRRSPAAAASADAISEARKPARSAELLGRIESDIAGTSSTAMQADDVLSELAQRAAPLYQKAYENSGPIIIPKELTQRASVSNAYKVMQKMGQERGYSLPDINESAVQPIKPMSLEHADLLKRAMDDVLYSAKQPDSGIGKAQLDDMKSTRTALVQAIDAQAGPDYAAARATFAGPAQAREALEAGQQVTKMSAEEVGRYMNDPNISDFEKQAFRIGAASALKGKVAGASDSREAANLFASPNAQQTMAMLSKESPSYLPELLRTQRKQAAFEQSLLGGSQTQPRAAADALLDDAMVTIPTKGDLVKSGLRKIGDRAITGNQATLNDLAAMLLSTDPTTNTNLLRLLQLRQALPDIKPSYLRPAAAGTVNSLQLLAEPPATRNRLLQKSN